MLALIQTLCPKTRTGARVKWLLEITIYRVSMVVSIRLQWKITMTSVNRLPNLKLYRIMILLLGEIARTLKDLSELEVTKDPSVEAATSVK